MWSRETRGLCLQGMGDSKHPNTELPNSKHPNSKWTLDAESLALGCPGLWKAGGHGILCKVQMWAVVTFVILPKDTAGGGVCFWVRRQPFRWGLME